MRYASKIFIVGKNNKQTQKWEAVSGRIVWKPRGEKTTGSSSRAVMTVDPGLTDSLVAETNLKLTCFCMHHMMNRVSHMLEYGDVTVVNIRTLHDKYESEKDYTFPKKEEFPKIDECSWSNIFDTLDHFLHTTKGEAGISIVYIVRKESVVVPEADQPTTDFGTREGKIIADIPHTHKEVQMAL